MRFWLLFRNRRARTRARRSGELPAGDRTAGPEAGGPGAPDRIPPRPGSGGRLAPPGSHRRTGSARGTDVRPGGPVPPPRSAPWPGAGPGTLRPPAPPPGAGPGTPRPPALRPGSGPSRTEHRRWGLARVAIRTAADAPGAATAPRQAPAAPRPPAAALRAAQAATPWYEVAQANRTAPGMRDCGVLERVLHREWTDTAPPESVIAINRLADLPRLIKDRLVAGLDAIHVGGGGVPDLDDMGRLSGIPLPSGRATWDACAGAYGERKIVVGSRPSPTPDVMCHEIGHALDDIDGPPGQWQSDSDAFCALYDQCLSYMVSNLHRQRGILGRREFFADAFAAIASRQRPALVDMLGGDTRAALNVMLYFNMRYGI
jgi:hypothetical protein